MSDGTTVYECTSTDEVVDLLQGGQAVFAIAVGRHVRDVEGTLAALPGERAHRDGDAPRGRRRAPAADELASRRQRRTTRLTAPGTRAGALHRRRARRA